MTPQIIKTNDGFMVETVDGDYLHDAQGNNLFDTREEAARLMQQDAQP